MNNLILPKLSLGEAYISKFGHTLEYWRKAPGCPVEIGARGLGPKYKLRLFCDSSLISIFYSQ